MRNILFLSLNIDEANNADLYRQLVNKMSSRDKVFVVTLQGDASKGEEVVFRRNLVIIKVRSGKMYGVNFIKKGITSLRIPRNYINAIKSYLYNTKFDLVVCPTPTITFEKVIRYVKKRDNPKVYLILRDVFPQAAWDLGIMKSRLLYGYFRIIEKRLYSLPDKIGVMSPRQIEYTVRHNKNVDREKLECLPNWVDLDELYSYEDGADADIYDIFNIKDKIIAFYGGNMGLPQEIPFLLELIQRYKDRDDIVFIMVGKGTEREKIIKMKESMKLDNLIIKDYIEYSLYSKLLKKCDIGLVNLNRKFTVPNSPAKLTSYFAAGVPVLAAVDSNNDLIEILDKYKMGLGSVTGDLESYIKNFETLINNKNLREEIGENGKKYAKEYLDVNIAYKKIMNCLPPSR